MNVRNATEKDVDAIVEMSSKFYATTHYRGFADMCGDTVEALARTLIDTGVMLVAEDRGEVIGMAGLFVGPFPFNTAKSGAYEVVWWVSQDTRGSGAGKSLMAAIEPACRARGCNIIQMLTLPNSPPHAGKIYEAMGFAHSETSYTKRL